MTLYLPEMRGRNSVSPQELVLYVNDREDTVIRRPSIALICFLKKRCQNAKFEVYELKSNIKLDLIIGLCVAVILIAINIFAN